ncbi:hypothetical protein C0989_009090 [Termitomyces sp. Mn162]|nr:hypothetical protein C0989_009090 [Termitomyces sp. Mn162]KAH0585379.1 hypothetical protein H2248_008616 [Termitomyces sp. 'cryptogamus']
MKAARLLLLSCIIVISASHPVSAYNYPRQNSSPSPSVPSSNTGTSSTTTLPSSTSTAPASTTSPSTTTESPTTQLTTSTPPTTTPVLPSTSPPSQPPATSNSQLTATSPTPATSVATSLSVSTDPGGSTTVVVVTNSLPPTSSDTATPTASKGADDDGAQSGLGTGSIVGISVAGGVAVIAILAFVVWKFTRKRFADFDDNEAIKWPELNAHGENPASHPLPVNNTGRSGFDTGSELSLSRVASASNYSTPDVTSGSDPYAVPPLPHMNPNQPYRDDPTAATGYYDPYRGPIPGSIGHEGNDDWVGENIPMTQLAGRSSPGPQPAFSAGGYGAGRQSPSPLGPYEGGRTGSPGPQVAYGGRASPGPQAAYGGRASPGPQAAFNAGRASPGPQATYDPYGKR